MLLLCVMHLLIFHDATWLTEIICLLRHFEQMILQSNEESDEQFLGDKEVLVKTHYGVYRNDPWENMSRCIEFNDTNFKELILCN